MSPHRFGLLGAALLIALAACTPVATSSADQSGQPSASPTATASEAAVASTQPSSANNATASLAGEWYCYGYQPGVGTNAVNVAGIIGGNTLLGSFEIKDGSNYVSFYGADPGTFHTDASGNIGFDSGGMLGLEGTYGAGPSGDLIDIHGVGNGWDDPSVVYLLCQRG